MYAHFISQSRELPMVQDFKMNYEEDVKKMKQLETQKTLFFAYCHKSLLPLERELQEEMLKAKIWVSQFNGTNLTKQSRVSSERKFKLFECFKK